MVMSNKHEHIAIMDIVKINNHLGNIPTYRYYLFYEGEKILLNKVLVMIRECVSP